MEKCFVLLQDKTALDDGKVYFLKLEWELYQDGTHSPIRGFIIDLFSQTNQIDEYPEEITLQDVWDYLKNEHYAPIIIEMGNIPFNN